MCPSTSEGEGGAKSEVYSYLTLTVGQVDTEAADAINRDSRITLREQYSLQLAGQVLEGLLADITHQLLLQ